MLATRCSSAEMSPFPPAGRSAICPSRGRPVDLVHLAAQTMGDRGLEHEILVLLDRQIDLMQGRLERAGIDDRASIAHAMGGSARNVGAFPLALVASSLERDPTDDGLRDELLAEMRRVSKFLAPLVGPVALD